MSDAGDRALNHGAAAYFALCAMGTVGSTVRLLLYGLWADLVQWLAVVLFFFLPFAIAMGLRRRERWSRWLGVRIGLGLAGGAVFSVANYLRKAVSGVESSDAMTIPELVAFWVVGAIAGFASLRLASKAAHEAIRAQGG